MSKKLGMGPGASTIKNTTWNGVTTAVGAVNSSRQHILVVVNHSGTAVNVTANLKNLGLPSNVALQVYRASGNGDAQTPVETVKQTVTNNSLSHTVSMAAYSVAGLIVSATSATSPAGPTPLPCPMALPLHGPSFLSLPLQYRSPCLL